MFCKKCGAKLESDAKFCDNCGTAIGTHKPMATPAISNETTDSTKNKNLNGLEGWLIIVGLGMLASGVEVFMNLFSGQGSTTDAINIILLVFIVYVAYLFFKRSHRFPKYFIIYLSAFAVLAVIAGIVTNWQDSSTLADPIVAAAIWIPYTLVSKRVKSTFVRA
jgi:uncharacterized membrane protein HdeD (DUF308 family)